MALRSGMFLAAAICVAQPRPAGPYAGEPPPLVAPRPALPTTAASAAGFAPPGWTVEREVGGDLDRDGRPDLVAVLKGIDPACLVPTDGPANPLDTNPRLVLVARGDRAGFRLLLANAAVVPRMDDPYMDDPLGEVTVRGGVLRLGLSYWRSMGGWTTFTSTLSFRWDGRRMRLIGFDRESVRRNTGETEGLSVNYLTGRARLTAGSIEDDADDVVRWRRLRTSRDLALETIGDGLALEPLQGDR